MYSPYQQNTADTKREGNTTPKRLPVLGVSADMAEIRDINVVQGRFFTPVRK